MNNPSKIMHITEAENVLCFQMDMECALLDGEQKSETAELLKEKEILDHLNRKIAELERNVIGEKTKVNNNMMFTIFTQNWSSIKHFLKNNSPGMQRFNLK